MNIPSIVTLIIAEIVTIVFVLGLHIVVNKYKSRFIDSQANPRQLVIAPIWRRVFAGVIDICLIYVIPILQFIVFSINDMYWHDLSFFPYMFFGTNGFIYCYFGYMWTHHYGQTIGKSIMALKIVKKNGSQMKLEDVLLRYFGIMIGGFLFYLGFIWAIFDKNHQAWHDKIAGTYVVES